MSVDTSLPPPPHNILQKLFGFARKRFSPPPRTETAREMMEKTLELEHEQEQPTFTSLEQNMFRNLLSFGSKRVADVMVPRVDIKCIEINQPMSDLIEVFRQAHHSRIPVYNEILDDPKGMLHVKDLLQWLIRESRETHPAATGPSRTTANGETLALIEECPSLDCLMLANIDLSQTIASTRLVRDVLFVPPGMPALDLLHRMQVEHVHLALVIDEYGGTDGLVSIEDLVEEIVGEIEDEHDGDKQAPLISGKLETGLRVSGRASIEELEKTLGFSLEGLEEYEDIDTVGGMIVALSGKVPTRGQIVQHQSGLEFEVVEVDARKIGQLMVRKAQ